jgi:endonuclease I
MGARSVARLFAVLIFLLAAAGAAPPDGYYLSAEGFEGATLKARLREIIDDHTIVAYADLVPVLRDLWEDPQDATKIALVYGSAPALKNATTWNREHLWPRSRGVNPSTAPDGGPDDSDLFHVVPADANVNSARSNLYFDHSRLEDGGFKEPAHIEAPLCSRDANSWQPPPMERGDIARALFYMAVRYDGSEPGTADLELLTVAPTDAQMANLATLLAWHAEDPPDAAEQARNDRIFTTYQHNRNPFIDRPEWVAAIWGTLTGVTTAQITASDFHVYENPGAPVTITVALNAPAPAGGLTLPFTLSGSASNSEFVLSGSALNLPAKTVTVPFGAVSSSFTLAAVADGVKEPDRTLTVALSPRADYDIIGGPAGTTILDEPIVSRQTLAAWNFDADSFPANIAANVGVANINTSTWSGLVRSFTGVTGQSLALEGTAATDSFIECTFSSVGWTNLRLTFSTRANPSDSFTSGTWTWSNDGAEFTAIAGVNTVATGTVFQSRLLDLSAIAGLQNQPNVTLRYHLSGAGQSQANNRIDDLVITGHRYTASWLARFPALSGPASDPGEDPDADSLDNFQEWAFDRDPLAQTSSPVATLGWSLAPDPAENDVVKRWPTVSFVRRTDAPRLLVFPEQSVDLRTWTGGCGLMSVTPGASAHSEAVTYRATIPAETSPLFFRLRVREE